MPRQCWRAQARRPAKAQALRRRQGLRWQPRCGTLPPLPSAVVKALAGGFAGFFSGGLQSGWLCLVPSWATAAVRPGGPDCAEGKKIPTPLVVADFWPGLNDPVPGPSSDVAG